MKYTPIPEPTSISLLRSFGLLLQQAGMYGMKHNVTALALRESFSLLESSLAVYGPVEIGVSENTLLVNALPVLSSDSAVRNFLSRIESHKLGGLLFSPEIDIEEFSILIRLLSSSSMSLAQHGGLKGAIDGAGLRFVKLVNTEYKKVPEDNEAPPPPPPPPPENKTFSLGANTGVLDISAGLATAGRTFSDGNAEEDSAASELADTRRRRRENASKMADMLRATAALIENEGALPAELGQKQILASIERILKTLEVSSHETKNQISKLAGQVEADSLTIASIESAAKRRGIGFHLTRQELLEHYAEINQEMLQPTTVSSGALDLLLSGKCGEMSPSQKEIVKLAFEGMGRVNQLIQYMSRISGLPESLTPDKAVISDTYT